MLIEPYSFILDYGITPSVLTASLDTSGADEKETEGIIDKPLHPGTSHTKDEAEAKEMACRYHRQIRGGIRESRKRGKS